MTTATAKADTPLAVTVGEPAGIGLDVLFSALNEAHSGEIDPLPSFVLFCDPDHLRRRNEGFASPLPEIWLPKVSPLEHTLYGHAAQPDTRDAAGVVESIERAVDSIRNGSTRAVVTLPINKKSLYDAGFDHPGHTEFLQTLAASWPQAAANMRSVMMLAGPDLRAVPVTIHIPLSAVPESLSIKLVLETIRITARDLTNRFGIETPRLAVAGLNPHAGEGGAMGREDDTIIRPAVQQACDDGFLCRGPLPADTMFHDRARDTYDAAICMYHDQALIPAKTLAFDRTVNVTLGLPFVRTSPDHGTAFDIAGTGKADPASFIEALRLADRMTKAHP